MDRHTILVVDDEPDVVKSVKDLLRLDHRVLSATRATDAVKILRDEEVHVIMTDQRMPETTGVQFLSQIRGDYPEAIRLLFTGYADIRAVIEAINQGNVYRYIAKPWDPDELQSIIREACDRYDLLIERKKMIAQLKQQNFELESSNTKLATANALKTNFIQVASHELRTPLTILLGLAGIAARVSPTRDESREWIAKIEQAAQRLNRIVNQLITMLSAGKFDQMLDRAPTDIAALVQQAVEDTQVFVETRRQSLSVELPENLGSMNVDALKIRDCIDHLLLNAIKFTPDGGHISISAARRLLDSVQTVEIAVADAGPGIDVRSQDRIFEPFFTGFDVQHHSSGHFEYGKKGIGLGLSIVRAFVALHGGSVRVKSEMGAGSVFTLCIPVHRVESDMADKLQ